MLGLFRNKAREARISRLYDQILAQARDPSLYVAGSVPDTVEGRTDMMLLHRSDHTTYCPYKGECSYFHIPSLGDAGRNAVETAAASIRDLRVAEVTKMDMKVEEGKVAAFRTRVSLSFKYEA